MAQKSFSAQVDAWVAKSERRIEAVFKESAQRVFEEALLPVGQGGNTPVDTGFMRASFMATLNAPVTDVKYRPSADATYNLNEGQYSLVIAGAEIGQVIYGVFVANYARIVENRYGFVRLAAQRWPQIVAQVTAQAKARFP